MPSIVRGTIQNWPDLKFETGPSIKQVRVDALIIIPAILLIMIAESPG